MQYAMHTLALYASCEGPFFMPVRHVCYLWEIGANKDVTNCLPITQLFFFCICCLRSYIILKSKDH